jgi:hypothetical protein
MKQLVFLFLMGVSISSFAARLEWDCESGSDPDKVDVQIYSEAKKTLMKLQEYFGDGDGYAEDLIEVRRLDDGNDSVLTYEQVENVQPKKGNIRVKPTRESRGVVFRFAPLSKDYSATIKGKSGPSGSDLWDEGLTCEKPQRPQPAIRGACAIPGFASSCISMDKKGCEAIQGVFVGGPC